MYSRIIAEVELTDYPPKLIRHLIANNGDKTQIKQLKVEQAKLNRAHKVMLHISKIYKHGKAESAKPNPDRAKIDRLKLLMTKRAKGYWK